MQESYKFKVACLHVFMAQDEPKRVRYLEITVNCSCIIIGPLPDQGFLFYDAQLPINWTFCNLINYCTNYLTK